MKGKMLWLLVIKLIHVLALEWAWLGWGYQPGGRGVRGPLWALCPTPHQGPVQTLHFVLRLGSCNAVGAQHNSLHPSYVTGVEGRCSENIGTRWWDIYFSKGRRAFVCRVRIGSEWNVLAQGKADSVINKNCKDCEEPKGSVKSEVQAFTWESTSKKWQMASLFSITRKVSAQNLWLHDFCDWKGKCKIPALSKQNTISH